MKYAILFILLIVIIIVAIYQLFIFKLKKDYNLKIQGLESKLADVKSTNILRELLEVSYEKESIGKASKKIIYILLQNFNINYCTVFLNTGNKLTACASNAGSKEIMKELGDYANSLSEMPMGVGGKKLYTERGTLSYNTAADRNINFSFFIPLKVNDNMIGALLIENVNYDDRNNDMGVEFFKVVIDTISITLQNLIYYDKIVNMATRDALTKMYNRRQMEKVLTEYMAEGKVFSVAMMDIDHFKKFNDTYGHAFGDLVLIEVSKFIKKQVTNIGEVFRYGGEEFLICFNNMNSEQAFEKLDNIRKGIEALTITNENNVSSHVTASFGIAEYPKNKAKDTTILKEFADQALYYSKEHGRNQVTIYNDIS